MRDPKGWINESGLGKADGGARQGREPKLPVSKKTRKETRPLKLTSSGVGARTRIIS